MLNERLTEKEALELVKSADLKELGRLATERKNELHPDNIVSFIYNSRKSLNKIIKS